MAEYWIEQFDSSARHIGKTTLRSALQLHQYRRSTGIVSPISALAPADGRNQNYVVRIGIGFRSFETRHGLATREFDDRSKRHRKCERQSRQDAVAGGQHGTTDQRSRQGYCWTAISQSCAVLLCTLPARSPGGLLTILLPLSLMSISFGDSCQIE